MFPKRTPRNSRKNRLRRSPEERPSPPGWWSGFLAGSLLALLCGCSATRQPARSVPVGPVPAASTGTVPVAGGLMGSDRAAGQLGLTASWVKLDQQLVMQGPGGTLELEAGKREARLNGLRVFLGQPPLLQEGELMLSRTDLNGLLVPIILGSGFRGIGPIRTVVVDAGHGGQDSGTRNTDLGLREKDLTLDVARRLREALVRKGFRVVMTREDDTFVPLEQRPEMAKGADLFISIHFNATARAAVSGTETYVLSRPGQASTGVSLPYDGDVSPLPGNRWDAASALFGYKVQRHLVRAFNTTDRGLKQARFAVLRDLPCPGILVESAFLSNKAEATRVASEGFRVQLAEMLARAIEETAAMAGGGS